MKAQLKYSLTAMLLAFVCAAGASAADLTRAVNVVEGTETKQYVGNQYGEVLYTFDMDAKDASACYGKCAEQWPPFLLSDTEAKALPAPYGTINRTTGTLQLTIDGKPVYTYHLNRVEGDDKGDSIGGVWHDIDFK